MAIQKKVNGTWQPINPKQLKGIPYTGTLPATLTGTKAGYLHRYKIYGNLEQTGTPTPENPIVPSECGERTGNLLNADAFYAAYKQSDGSYQSSMKDFYNTHITPFSQSDIGKTFTLAIQINSLSSTNVQIRAMIGGVETRGSSTSLPTTLLITVSPESTDDYFYLNYGSGGGNLINISNIMLNIGSTALPYEPYGYKLPLTSAGQDVDIYIGESQTTRRIKKRVLTGEEYVGAPSNYPNHFYISVQDGLDTANITTIAVSHYEAQKNATLSNLLRYLDGTACFRTGNDQVWFRDDRFTSNTDFKTFLQQQYANGTPVTVWYVLATEQTSTLNEPLRKIGNYADTIDSTQTAAQIPTSAGSTTISWAGSGLAPSQFDSIQEWVDIPTYTYTNGEWVADN